jgi:GNAT superfamily N-acetyltransferase
MPELSVRAAGDQEFEPARGVLRAAYAEYESVFPAANWVPYLQDILDLEGRADESQLLIAEILGQVVGCVSYFPPGSKAAYPSDSFSERWPGDWSAIRLLAVDPQQRGNGVGRRLTDACVDQARHDNAPALGLHTTAPMAVARAMYERMGFERVPQYDFQPGPTVLVEAYRLLL